MAFLPHDSPPKPVPLYMQRTIVALIRETLSLGRRKANFFKKKKKGRKERKNVSLFCRSLCQGKKL